MNFDIAINNGILLSGHNGYTPFVASMGIIGKKIVYLDNKEIENGQAKELINAKGKIVMPGLYNCHCHGDMTIARGMGDDLTLKEQIDTFTDSNWFYKFMNDDERYLSRVLTYVEALLSGTVFIVENMYWGLGTKSIDAMNEVGIRGALVEDIRYDFNKPNEIHTEKYLKEFISQCQVNELIPVIGNISEEDFNLPLLEKTQQMIKKLGCFETRHLAENDWRVEAVQKNFGSTPVSMLKKFDGLHKKLIGSHGIYISDSEIDMMSKEEVKVANTPLCEMKIADGIAPIPKFLEKGVVVALGTDGAMWNNSNDIFREMKGMVLLHNINSGIRSLKAKDVLDMATINGARLFGLEEETGTLEVGKDADIIFIDSNKPHLSPLRVENKENVASTVVYSATGNDVTDVFIKGKHIVSDGKLTTIDVEALLARVNKISERIGKDYELSRKINED